jgi:hypothetical protein
MLAATLAITMALALPSGVAAQEQPFDEAVAFMGGEEALTGLSAIAVSATGTRLGLDEGPTPGQPPFPEASFESQVTVDVAGDRMRLDHVISTPTYGIEGRAVSEVVIGDVGFIDGQDNNFGSPGTAPMLSDRLASIKLHQRLLNPHLLVLEALTDPSIVTVLDDVEVDGTAHHALEIAHGAMHIVQRRYPDKGCAIDRPRVLPAAGRPARPERKRHDTVSMRQMVPLDRLMVEWLPWV